MRAPGILHDISTLTSTRWHPLFACDEEADAGTREPATHTGIDVCPEGGAAWSALQTLRASGAIRDQDRVVVFNTGTGLKYR